MSQIAKNDKRLVGLRVKDIVSIVSLLAFVTTLVTSVVAWVHAEVTVPQILQQTMRQTLTIMHEHESKADAEFETIRAGAFTQREFKLWSEQVLKRLDAIEAAVREK